ncbi:MAG: Smr/MutS family protein [Treponema sp.]|nr:Smr/MutS family protein [Treponema sp.]
MNEKTFRLLEYREILKRVAACALSEEAAARILDEAPLTDPDAVEELKTRVAAIREKAGQGEKRESLPPVAFLFPKLAVQGASLELEEAYALGIFIHRGEALKNWLLGTRPLEDFLASIPGCSDVAAGVFRVIDRDGKLRDLPEFRAIRRRIRNLQAELEAAVARYTGMEETRRMLQSPLPSQRDGRLVLALKANFRGRIRGIVHEVSSTGQTIFVEPEEAVERNNDLLIEQRRLDAEILRVLRELTAGIAGRREDLALFHGKIIGLEILRAKARYAFETRGRFAVNAEAGLGGTPAAGSDPPGTGQVILREARHPLLGSSAVPIDLAMGEGIRTVIVTGPNTGGKTVALKTLGLFALMNQIGLALPADEGTVLPVFEGVYADIGDEQSLSQSLSTFSAHMVNIAGITARAGERSLVLLDELGSGTDPEEGSAIAMAILDYLIGKKARLVVTTHHGVLKNYGYTREGVENASMEFDSQTLSPTYRILMGIPGESRALDIAARNGLRREIVEQARSYLAEGRSDVSALIAGLKEKHRELGSAREQAQAEELRLREDRRKADLKELRLRQKEAELKAGLVGRLEALLAESRKTLENLVREVREGELSREKTLKVKEFLRDLEETVKAEDAALKAEQADIAGDRRIRTGETGEAAGVEEALPGGAAPALAPGVEVLAGEYKRRGRIVRLDRRNATGAAWIVEIGSLKLSMDERDLIPLAPEKTAPKPLAASLDLASPQGPRLELSLLGMRLEEALETLRRQIDAAVLAGMREFAVIHGKGEGILQKGVHDYLRNEGAVADYYFSRPELGGFGRTEVVLK